MFEKLNSVLAKIFEQMGYSEYFGLAESNRLELCDYQINSVFNIAKKENLNPEIIGEKIINEINKLEDFSLYFKTVVFCKPGFINITVSDVLINECIRENMTNLGIKKTNIDDLYFLDYGGPNIAKPLHVGHLRPAIIGESFKRILNTKGYKTICDVHLGDYGLQIGQVIYGIKTSNLTLDDITIEYLNEIYPKISALCKENEEVYEKCKIIVYELQNGNSEYIKLWKKISEVSLNDIKRLYNFLSVDFDLWLGESDSFKFIPIVVEYLENKGIVELDAGAKIIRVEKSDDKKEMPPLILKKSDGASIYATTDLATIYERIQKYNPKYILYFTDFRQSLHFEQVFRVCEKSGLNKSTYLEHIYNGTINGSDNKPFKTRSGETLKLEELINMVRKCFLDKKDTNKQMSEEDINIIVNSIIKFADLSNARDKNYSFDIAKFSETTGKTGPYILYTVLRIKKILKDNKITNSLISNKIYNKIDRDLRLNILKFDKTIDNAVKERMPSYVANYAFNLAENLNSFYQSNIINNLNDETNKNDWLNILNLSYNILECSLKMLAIDIPSIM